MRNRHKSLTGKKFRCKFDKGLTSVVNTTTARKLVGWSKGIGRHR